MKVVRIIPVAALSAGLALAAPAQASDVVAGAIIGAGAGALFGQAFGGRDGAIVGGAIGAAAGASAAGGHGYYGPRHYGVAGWPAPPAHYYPPYPQRVVVPAYRYYPPRAVYVPPAATVIIHGGPRYPGGSWHGHRQGRQHHHGHRR